MTEQNHPKRLLLKLYLINAAANMIGSLIVGALALWTPTEFFKLWRSYIVDDGWIYISMIYPIIIAIGSGLQYIAQKPLKKYFDSLKSKDVNEPKLFLRARRRLLVLAPLISLLNICMWTGLSLLDASWMVLAKLIPSFNTSPLFSVSLHTIWFSLFRGIVVGCVTAGLGLLLVEAYSRKHLIPVFFPEGRLALHKKVWKVTIRQRIQFLYFSGTVVPMVIFVGTLFYVESEAGGSAIPVTVFGKDLLFYTISLYVMFVLLSLWLNFLVGRSILEPIRDMIATIRKVREGDFNHRVRVVSNDEMGILGDGINKMTTGLVEGEVLRHSYNLAREAQLALLPGAPPHRQRS